LWGNGSESEARRNRFRMCLTEKYTLNAIQTYQAESGDSAILQKLLGYTFGTLG
jgi:hypothetical protein